MTNQRQLQFEDGRVTVGGKTWSMEKTVIDAVLVNDTVLLIFDSREYPENKAARNLEGYTLDGHRLWVAENPTDTPNEAYAEFLANDEGTVANSVDVGDLSGFRCSIDLDSGKLVNLVYTK